MRRASVSLVLLALMGAAPSLAQEPRLFYEEDGDGPPIVLIADWAHDTSTWFRLLPALRPGFRLVRYDLRAHGRSESPADEDLTLAAHRRDLERVLEGLEIERPHLVGIGAGGAIALSYAGARPEAVASVVAINPRLGWTASERSWWERFLAAYDRVGRPTLAEYGSVLVDRWVGTDFATSEPWVLEFYDLVLRRQSAPDLLAALRAALEWPDPLPLEARSGVPVLLVRGEESIGGGRDDDVRAAFPGTRATPLEKTGEAPAIEAPRMLGRLVREFVERVEAPAP